MGATWHRRQYFWCGSNVNLIQLCASKTQWGSGEELLVGRSGAKPPPLKLKHLVFGCSVESTNLLAFLIFGNAKQKSQIAYTAHVVLLNLTFN